MKRAMVGILVVLASYAVSQRMVEAQEDPWRDLGGMNGVQVHALRDGAVTCYVTSGGGVSCLKR